VIIIIRIELSHCERLREGHQPSDNQPFGTMNWETTLKWTAAAVSCCIFVFVCGALSLAIMRLRQDMRKGPRPPKLTALIVCSGLLLLIFLVGSITVRSVRVSEEGAFVCSGSLSRGLPFFYPAVSLAIYWFLRARAEVVDSNATKLEERIYSRLFYLLVLFFAFPFVFAFTAKAISLDEADMCVIQSNSWIPNVSFLVSDTTISFLPALRSGCSEQGHSARNFQPRPQSSCTAKLQSDSHRSAFHGFRKHFLPFDGTLV